MQTLDPVLVSSLSALYAAVLMVHAGVGKRLLSWRPQTVRRRWARRRLRQEWTSGRSALRRRPPDRR
jgi:hypothetical protein